MTTLNKNPNKEIIPGTIGQVGVTSTPATDGYYTTIQVATTQAALDQASGGESQTTSQTIADQYKLRLATYDEIVQYLWKGNPDNLCGISAYIMETVNNTKYMYDPLYSIYGTGAEYSVLCIASIENVGTGICHMTLNVGDALPEKEESDTYAQMHPDGDPYGYWEFDDYYDCTVVNGVEEVTRK